MPNLLNDPLSDQSIEAYKVESPSGSSNESLKIKIKDEYSILTPVKDQTMIGFYNNSDNRKLAAKDPNLIYSSFMQPNESPENVI